MSLLLESIIVLGDKRNIEAMEKFDKAYSIIAKRTYSSPLSGRDLSYEFCRDEIMNLAKPVDEQRRLVIINIAVNYFRNLPAGMPLARN